MAYGYYSDPGTSFGTTGQTTNNETFIQRQNRLQQTLAQKQQQTQSQPASGSSNFTPVAGATTQVQQQQQAQPAAGSTGTPVAGNGSIPPPTPAPAPVAAPAPQAAPAPAAAPQPPTPTALRPEDTSITKWVPTQDGTGWVPSDHPLAWKGPAGAGATGTGAPTTGTPGSALGGPAEAAKSGMFTQYAPMEHDFQNWQQLELVSQLLANPETLNANTIEQMKQKQMEEALSMSQQLQQQRGDAIAARGFGGGQIDASNRAMNEAMMQAILGQNRDIEISAAQQNRQDILQALGVTESILGGQVGRSSNTFNDILAGQQANRGDFWTGKQLDLQKELGVGGLGLDQQRINNQNRQFDASHGLNILQFLEGQRQHDNGMGFNWAGLNANQQGNTMDRILGILGM
jgi:hypothetical protein